MSKRSLVIFIGALGLLTVIAVVLRGCLKKDPPALATLIETQGAPVERDLSAQREAWQPAKAGASFALGDGLRTSAAATAKLKLYDDSQLAVMPSTTLRFLNDEQQGGLNVDLQTGEATLRAGSHDLSLRTHVGLAVIKASSEVTLQRDGDSLSIAVLLGSVQFRDGDGKQQQLDKGADLRVGIGMAIIGAELTPKPEVTARTSRMTLDVRSPGARRRAARQRNWEDIDVGEHEIEPGTELRLSAGGTAVVARGNDNAELRGAGEYMLGAGDSLVETRSGGIVIESNDGDVQVGVPGGLIVVRKANGGSRVNLTVGAEEGELEVERGSTSATLNGETEELSAGDQRTWTTGGETDEVANAGETTAPTYFNITVPAGESFILHSPQLPVAVAVDFSSKCPAEGELEMLGKRQKLHGTGSANMLLPAGTRSYVVRCGPAGAARKQVARGTVRVLLDPGTRKLPPSPPTSFVEADGRTYTIYYPNQLPDISLRWPNAPTEKGYQLEVDGQPQPTSTAEHLFKSGSLRDGTHQLSFRGTTRRSRTTTIIVKFDNNAPTASLISPTDRGFKAGDAVKVQGVSLQAWKVSLEGGTIAKESDGRFSGTITPSATHPDIAVRLFHPRLGIHYYLRRAASSQ